MLNGILKRLFFRGGDHSLKEKKENTMRNSQGVGYESDLRVYSPRFFGSTLEQITGYREDEFTQGLITWDKVIHPDDISLFMQEDERLKSIEGHVFNIEYRIIHKSGEVRWVRDIGHVIRDPRKNYPQISGSVYDITQQRRTVDNMGNILGISPDELLS